MSEIATAGLDLAKNGVQLHEADAWRRAMLHRKLGRSQVLEFLGGLPFCTVAMEACCRAHYWGREIGKLGQEVGLIPPAHVKPFARPLHDAGTEGPRSKMLAPVCDDPIVSLPAAQKG